MENLRKIKWIATKSSDFHKMSEYSNIKYLIAFMVLTRVKFNLFQNEMDE